MIRLSGTSMLYPSANTEESTISGSNMMRPLSQVLTPSISDTCFRSDYSKRTVSLVLYPRSQLSPLCASSSCSVVPVITTSLSAKLVSNTQVFFISVSLLVREQRILSIYPVHFLCTKYVLDLNTGMVIFLFLSVYHLVFVHIQGKT